MKKEDRMEKAQGEERGKIGKERKHEDRNKKKAALSLIFFFVTDALSLRWTCTS